MLLVAQGMPFKEDYSKSKNKQNETIEKKMLMLQWLMI